jgi:hypothetical protein
VNIAIIPANNIRGANRIINVKAKAEKAVPVADTASVVAADTNKVATVRPSVVSSMLAMSIRANWFVEYKKVDNKTPIQIVGSIHVNTAASFEKKILERLWGIAW